MGCSRSSASPLPVVATRLPCRYAAACCDSSAVHRGRFCHPGDPDYIPRTQCRFAEGCLQWKQEDHAAKYSHPGDPDYRGPRSSTSSRSTSSSASADARPSKDVLDSFAVEQPLPPEVIESSLKAAHRPACKFGLNCWRKNSEHLAQFSHPGDVDYRMGIVVFKDGAEPQFGTMRQLFDFCDPEGHRNFGSKNELQQALTLLEKYHPVRALDVDKAWQEMDGERNSHAGFAKFAAWAQQMGVDLPIGVELAPVTPNGSNDLSCGFLFPDGRRCSCKHFKVAARSGGGSSPHMGSLLVQFCVCDHKRSMHTQRVVPEQMAPVPHYWKGAGAGAGGMEELGPEGRLLFQRLFDHTHKERDNWTRDRGCSLHGLGCRAECAFKHKNSVPKGYRVVSVMRNMRTDLWGVYALNRGAITQECQGVAAGQRFHPTRDVKTLGVLLEDTPHCQECNEWFLFHGTRPEHCLGICSTNFSLSHAGTGATWKDGGAERGLPLYGYGIYFAESITKADEYTEAVKDGQLFEGCHSVLVCRVTGGRTQYCDTDKIDPPLLQRQVVAGPFHSVLGDRVAKLGKPYREVVVYDSTQCYPEYLVYYNRIY